MAAYYNEIDPYAAQWLRNLIAAGHIADGEVDTRSISDIAPEDIHAFTQCHFFAGIGVWSYALRLAQWPDTRRVWTGSCPCQPFSVAGRSAGVHDERHLWPHWHWLIEQCRPPVIFGEQVEAAIRHGWLDAVQADLEGLDYAVGAVGVPAAGVGAPHIRARLWFVADSSSTRLEGCDERTLGGQRPPAERGGSAGGLADAMHAGRAERRAGTGDGQITRRGGAGGLADAQHDGRGRPHRDQAEQGGNGTDIGLSDRGRSAPERQPAAGPTHGHWGDADWLHCRDGKWRPVEPGTFPLAHGAPTRVGRLRAYGNAIVPQVAAEVIRAYMECRP